MYMILLEKYPVLVNQERVLLQQDNTRPHTAKKTLQKIEELEDIELLPHPAFSPDLEPSDYCFFLWPSSFVVKSFNFQRTWKLRLKKFLLPKIKGVSTRPSRNWLKNG
jgi:hypothetical protein